MLTGVSCFLVSWINQYLGSGKDSHRHQLNHCDIMWPHAQRGVAAGFAIIFVFSFITLNALCRQMNT